jgi:hypothetical protein
MKEPFFVIVGDVLKMAVVKFPALVTALHPPNPYTPYVSPCFL